jgi:CRISPR type III-A/MTUBE-associated protein Csm6
MLHICRHYQPDEVVLYLSKEMTEKHREDNRYVKCIELLGELLHHNFLVRVIENPEFVDVQKYDVYYEIFHDEIKKISEQMTAEDELLVNMASGTPAMKSALLIMATLAEYRFKAIQVSTPLKRMNSDYENRDAYDVEESWQLDEDNEEGSKNRCEEVRCMNLVKLLKIDMIKKHLSAYDYHAALELGTEIKEEISDKAYMLLQIADLRMKLNFKEISRLMNCEKFDIYPVKDAGKMRLFEYACVLRIKVLKEEYADFIRGITPIVVDLLEMILKLKMGIDIEQCCNISKGVKKWDRDKLAANGLLELLNNAYKASGGINNGPVYSHALKYIIDEKSDDAVLKEKVAEMIEVEQKVRNMAAHQIVSVTEQWFKENTGKTPKDIMQNIQYLIVQAGIGVKKEDWNTYDNMNSLIAKYLG